jgi:Flp pilus assembly protein TadD
MRYIFEFFSQLFIKYNEAVECFNKALEIDPKNGMIWTNKGLAVHKLGKYNEAVECFNKALEINPKNALAWYTKGLDLVDLGKYN